MGGTVLILHGVQFKNLFLCTQVIATFCYDRIMGSATAAWEDAQAALAKLGSDEATGDEKVADAKAAPENKHAKKRADKKDESKPKEQQQEEDIAKSKKVMKAFAPSKIQNIVFELCIAAMACHMVMEHGLMTKVVTVYAIVNASKDVIAPLLHWGEHEDLGLWKDILLAFVLYSIVGSVALLMPSFALAINVALCGAQLVTTYGLKFAESKNKLPQGFASSLRRFALLGGLAAFGTLWQYWALLADSGMSFWFKAIYLPAYMAENFISLL